MGFFTKKIISLEDKFFGLDLSDLSVKVVQLEKDGQLDKVRSYYSTSIPRGCIEDGNIINKKKIIEAIRMAVKKSGPKKISTKKVICSLPESKAFLRIISMPKVSENETAEAIKWEIEANIPLSVDQVYYDWQFLGESDGKQNILTVAVSRDIVDNTIEVLSEAGLSVYGLELESIASARSLISQKSAPEEISLIIDLGAEKTSFIITEGTVPYFTSSIPFSSEVLTDAIVKSLNISKEEAEEIKIIQGIENSGEISSIFNSIRPMLENLSCEIEKTIDFYQSICKENCEIGKIIIFGGGSNLKGIIPYLTTRINKEVAIGDPWVNLKLGNNLPIISKDKSIRYVTALGLALKKIDYGN